MTDHRNLEYICSAKRQACCSSTVLSSPCPTGLVPPMLSSVLFPIRDLTKNLNPLPLSQPPLSLLPSPGRLRRECGWPLETRLALVPARPTICLSLSPFALMYSSGSMLLSSPVTLAFSVPAVSCSNASCVQLWRTMSVGTSMHVRVTTRARCYPHGCRPLRQHGILHPLSQTSISQRNSQISTITCVPAPWYPH